MTTPLRHRSFTIEYVEPDAQITRWQDNRFVITESTFSATCDDCGQAVRAVVHWNALRGAIDELIIINAFGSKLDEHARRHHHSRNSSVL